MRGSMFGEDALPCAATKNRTLGVGDMDQYPCDIFRVGGDKYFFSRSEKVAKPRPEIGQDGRSAGRSLEESDRGRVTSFDHVVAGEVKRET